MNTLDRLYSATSRCNTRDFTTWRAERPAGHPKTPTTQARVCVTNADPVSPRSIEFPRICKASPDTTLTSLGYFRPAAIWLAADLQSSLRLASADLMQVTFATRVRASAQCCFRSAVHAFAAAAAPATKF